MSTHINSSFNEVKLAYELQSYPMHNYYRFCTAKRTTYSEQSLVRTTDNV